MKKNLEKLQDFVNKMKNTSSLNEKKVIIGSIQNDEFIKKALNYALDPYKKYYLTSKNCKKNADLCDMNSIYDDIFGLLDDLNGRVYTGHDAIALVNAFITEHIEYEDLIFSIIDRNLEIRASESVINKVIPNLIPTFDVALANKYDEKTKKKVDFEKDVWYVSRKLDGVRCLIIVDDKGKAKSFARSGKQFHTLSLVEKELEELGVKNVVYDGEMCIVDEEGNEDFQSIMKEIGRKDHVIQNGLFQIFDFIPYRMFSKGYGETGLFSQRINALQHIVLGKQNNLINFLEQSPISSFKELDDLTITASKRGWEGLMIRKNVPYQGKRSNDILKVKTFYDSEYKVIETFFGPLRYIKEGVEIEEEMLSGVAIEHKGNTVRVGSGFTIDQRKNLFINPHEILGKTITVQYFEESKNQSGEYSLRFPVIKVIHGNERKF